MFYNRDLSLPKQLDDIIQRHDVSVIFHLADVVAGIGFIMNNQGLVYHTNTLINTHVFDSIRSCGDRIKHLINIGTACSFPKHLQNSVTAQLKETDLYPAAPESAYGWSKLMSCYEAGLLSTETGIPVTNLLFHNVYGTPCDFGERSQVLPSLVYKVIRGDETLNVWGSGNQGRAFLHVDDAVESMVLAYERQPNETIQIGPRECITIRDAATLIIDISGRNIPIVYDLAKPEGDIGRCADYTKAQRLLGWSPKVSFADGVRNLYSWIRLQNDIHRSTHSKTSDTTDRND